MRDARSENAAKPNALTLLVERRAARLAELPPVAEPPVVEGSGDNPLDRFIVASWSSLPSADRPAALCDDATFARRVYLDLTGVIPSRAELNRFLADSATDKRSKLVDRLLDRKAEYAAHWTVFWEDALASQNVLAQGGIPTRGNYRQWLLDSFTANKPYDVMLAELIDPTMPGHQAAVDQDLFGTKYQVEFVRNEDHTVTLQTAAAVGQVFLSSAMKCASCHDHFENPAWTQERFLGFAGLFAPHDLEKIRCDVHSGQQVAARFPFDLPGPAVEIPTQLDERLHVAAQLIVDPANELFAKSIVNRLWKRYLGWGLFEPVDDYRPDRPASHPELLAWLARDFVAHGCDLKHTIRLILTSRTYQLPYDSKFADRFDAADPTAPRYFRSPALRRLTAEQVIDSVRMATAGQLLPGERAFLDARSTALAQVLGRPASRNEISTSRSDESAVVQALELLNGPELQALIADSALVAQPTGKTDAKQLVDRVYRSLLSRPATVEEKRLGQALLAASTSTSEGLKDMCWALVVSPEFQFIK
ncbi:MAG TPA: DUF1549 and DUF1553 domain-containing protein [Pirellulales bacterium]|nr:DUF1549 and DUF1553 domain-containing protein [Pirellulales bacterium]